MKSLKMHFVNSSQDLKKPSKKKRDKFNQSFGEFISFMSHVMF